MTATGSAPPVPRSRERQLRTVLELALCGVLAVVPYLWRVVAGTRRLPNDDTWAYERIFATFLDTGRIVLIDWNDINLVGMLPVARVWVAIVGHGPLQLHLLGALMALIALLALRSILRLVAPEATMLGIASLGVFSGFVVTTGTFMADQFALAGGLVAIALAAHAVASPRPDRVRYLLVGAAVVAALFAFSVRQQSAVVAVTVVAVLFMARPRLPLGWLGFAGPFGVLAGVFHLWRSALPDGGTVTFTFSSRMILAGWLVLGLSLCVALLPLVFASARREVNLAVRLLASAAAVVFALAVDAGAWVNDYLSPLGQLARGGAGVRAFAAVVLVNVVLTVVWAVRARRPELGDPILAGLLAGAALSVTFDVVAVALSSEYYSRYSLVTLALLLVVLARSVPRAGADTPGSGGRAWGAVAVLGLLAIWALDVTQAEPVAAQRAAELAACAGIEPHELDAGMVWMGSHSTGVVVADHLSQPWIDDGLPRTQYRRVFPNSTRRAVMLDDLPADLDGLGVEPVEGSGVLPLSSSTYWLVVADGEEAEALGACARRAAG